MTGRCCVLLILISLFSVAWGMETIKSKVGSVYPLYSFTGTGSFSGQFYMFQLQDNYDEFHNRQGLARTVMGVTQPWQVSTTLMDHVDSDMTTRIESSNFNYSHLMGLLLLMQLNMEWLNFQAYTLSLSTDEAQLNIETVSDPEILSISLTQGVGKDELTGDSYQSLNVLLTYHFGPVLIWQRTFRMRVGEEVLSSVPECCRPPKDKPSRKKDDDKDDKNGKGFLQSVTSLASSLIWSATTSDSNGKNSVIRYSHSSSSTAEYGVMAVELNVIQKVLYPVH